MQAVPDTRSVYAERVAQGYSPTSRSIVRRSRDTVVHQPQIQPMDF